MRAYRRMVAVLAAGLLIGPAAQALTVTLADPNQTIARPGSGSVEVFFYGTISFGADEVYDSATIFDPRRSEALAYSLQSSKFCAPAGDDSVCKNDGYGLLFSFLVKSTDPLGLYDRRSVDDPAIFTITVRTASSGPFLSVINPYSIRVVEGVVPLPAAAWLLLSGLGGLGFLGRRRKTA